MHPLEKYLSDVRLVHASGAGTPETSYYNALGNLLNEVGRELRPRVAAVMHPEDVRKIQQIARRIAAQLLLEPELDANYLVVKAAVYRWGEDSQGEE